MHLDMFCQCLEVLVLRAGELTAIVGLGIDKDDARAFASSTMLSVALFFRQQAAQLHDGAALFLA